jgi:hypothetical protein
MDPLSGRTYVRRVSMKTLMLQLFMAVFILFLGGPATPVSASELFPLKVGTAWQYAAHDDRNSWVMTMLVSGTASVQGAPGAYFVVERLDVTGAPDSQRYQQANLIRAARGSVYFFGGTDIRTGNRVEYLFFKEAPVGTEWSYVMLDGTRRFLKVADRPAQVKVPAGTFTGCFHYLDSLNGTFVVGKDVIGQTWICPGVGAVKMIEYPRTDNPKAARTFELKSYSTP